MVVCRWGRCCHWIWPRMRKAFGMQRSMFAQEFPSSSLISFHSNSIPRTRTNMVQPSFIVVVVTNPRHQRASKQASTSKSMLSCDRGPHNITFHIGWVFNSSNTSLLTTTNCLLRQYKVKGEVAIDRVDKPLIRFGTE